MTPRPNSNAGGRPVLKVCDLAKTFEMNGEPRPALAPLTFSIYAGEMVCVLGRSGCGKTTLLNLLAGFIAPSAGAAVLDGRAISRPGPDRCVVFQQPALFPWLTVHENVAFGLWQKGESAKTIRAETRRHLEMVGLSAFSDYMTDQISGGMTQRVALARVLVMRPRLLLMDEPFASLDAVTRNEMHDLLLSIWESERITVLFVTHSLEEAVKLADRIIMIQGRPGRIVAEVPVELDRPRHSEEPALRELCRSLHGMLGI